MVQYVTGVNTDASFIHTWLFSFPGSQQWVLCGYFAAYVYCFKGCEDAVSFEDFSVKSVYLTLDFTAVLYCFMCKYACIKANFKMSKRI